jgi:hypothetical protein
MIGWHSPWNSASPAPLVAVVFSKKADHGPNGAYLKGKKLKGP